MNSQRRAFLLFLLLAVTLCWALSLAGQRKARAMQRVAAAAVARTRHFEARQDAALSLVEVDGSVIRVLVPDPGSPEWLKALSTTAEAAAPPGAELTAQVGPLGDLAEIRASTAIRLVDTGMNLLFEFKLPPGSTLRGDFRISAQRDKALAVTAAQGSGEFQLWLYAGGAWKALEAQGVAPLGDSIQVSPGWAYLGFEGRNQAGESETLAAPLSSLDWKLRPGWSLVGIDDDGTAHLAKADALEEWKIPLL